jgi:hypothetical protein
MRLSTSLSSKIIDSIVGGIVSNLLINRRRNTLFFEDILAEYVRKCEKEGYSQQIGDIGTKWGALIIKQLVPPLIKKRPFFAVNTIMKEIWTSYGILDDLFIEKNGQILILKSKNEGITRLIGSNNLIIGAFRGVLNILFNSDLETINVNQNKQLSEYDFRICEKPFDITGKDRSEYLALNNIPKRVKGYDIKSTLRTGIFSIKNNKIYFRGRTLPILEPTLLHLISQHNILLDEVPLVSYNYFREIICEDSTSLEKLVLLKNLFQAMGLGLMNVAVQDKRLLIKIEYPPFGLQLEKDNWRMLLNVILGYSWLISRDYRIKEIKEGYKKLTIHIST